MDPEKKKRLEAAGWKFGDAADFLELTDVERQLVEVRLGLARAVRAAREAKGWTQGALAKALGSSQSRVAKLESERNPLNRSGPPCMPRVRPR